MKTLAMPSPRSCILLLFLLLPGVSLPFLHGESFRGEFALSLTPAAASDTGGVTSGGNGAFSLFKLAEILYPENPLAESVRVILELPRGFLRYRDSFSISIYGSYRPGSGKGTQSLSGTLLYQDTLPSFGRIAVQIPLQDGAESPGGAGVISLNRTISEAIFPLAIQIVPVMKGLPSELVYSEIGISTELLLEDAGFLELQVQDGSGNSLMHLLSSGTSKINGTTIAPETLGRPCKLPVGLHNLQLEIPGYAAENSSFSISRGETSRLYQTLKPLLGNYRIQAPQGTQLFIDGERVPSQGGSTLSGELEPGEHLLLFQFGDYQLSRKLAVQGGKSYNIELFFDIRVEVR